MKGNKSGSSWKPVPFNSVALSGNDKTDLASLLSFEEIDAEDFYKEEKTKIISYPTKGKRVAEGGKKKKEIVKNVEVKGEKKKKGKEDVIPMEEDNQVIVPVTVDVIENEIEIKEREPNSQKKRKKNKPSENKNKPSENKNKASENNKNKTSDKKQVPPVSSVELEIVPDNSAEVEIDEEQIKSNAGEWLNFELSIPVLFALQQAKFVAPTPIQKAVLPKTVIGRRDIIASAQTGSGKTLAFGIPIIERLLKDFDSQPFNEFSALIMSPTRELALQIVEHLKAIIKFTPITIIGLVGGMAIPKQQRLLSKKPNIVVATPGRLWEFMSLGETHVADVSKLRFLVLDEADRMMESGHFKELELLLNYINHYGKVQEMSANDENQLLEDSNDNAEVEMSDNDNMSEDEEKKDYTSLVTLEDKLKFLGLSLNDFNEKSDKEKKQVLKKVDKLTRIATRRSKKNDKVQSSNSNFTQEVTGIKRQTFLFSATMSLLETGRFQARKDGKPYVPNSKTVDRLGQLMNKLQFRTTPEVIDLTSNNKTPVSIDETMISAVKEEKDFYLYYFLTRFPGRTLIFVNAISCLRRLVSILKLLKLPVLGLHANMQQRQRLKNLDRFKNTATSILVASDVAARGLDIPLVQHVVHYQLPRTAEIYVHRIGRSGRANTKGFSLALISPDELKNYRKICSVLERPSGLTPLVVDNGWIDGCRARVVTARKLDQLTNTKNQATSSSDWFTKNAKEADIVWEGEEQVVDKKQLSSLTYQLKVLMETPLLPKGASRNFVTGSDLSGLDINTRLAILDGKSVNSLEKDLISSAEKHAQKGSASFNKKLLGKRKL